MTIQTFKIEHNVPLTNERGLPARRKYDFPFDRMKPGDSFLIEVPFVAEGQTGHDDAEKWVNAARTTVRSASVKARAHITTRVVRNDKAHATGLRVWFLGTLADAEADEG